MMNYYKIYNSIIENRKNNSYNGYTETHHILPRCLGGSDEADNLVKLSAKEHYICHLLLTRMYKYNTTEYHKMVHAFLYMIRGIHNDRHITSNHYENLKIINAKYLSETRKGKSSGMIWICNNITNKSMMIWATESIPDGWVRGSLNGKGISRSPEIVKKMVDSMAKLNRSGENNKRYGIKWFHNIEKQTNKQFNIKEMIPEGWNIGRVNDWDIVNQRKCANCGNLLLSNNKKAKTCSKECKYNRDDKKGYIWAYNENTLEQIKFKNTDDIPKGFVIGRKPIIKKERVNISGRCKIGYKWIYNLDTGETKQVLKDSNITGWANGKIKDAKQYQAQILQDKIVKDKLLSDNKKYYTELYEIYKVEGWLKMKEITNYNSSLSTFLSKCPLYVDDYAAQPGKRRG